MGRVFAIEERCGVECVDNGLLCEIFGRVFSEESSSGGFDEQEVNSDCSFAGDRVR